VIEIIHVSKKFRIWEDRSRDLKETTINFLRGKKRSFREVWALQGIHLRIGAGETVAFIGENGSGKSTLLKLLGGIYAPDKGKIITQGKISSLLELGVGFHPDLTGEENIYLNGAMLGFDSAEMSKRFDQIISFSEIGDFVYSPIRTYSSGMLMRLGFSVAMCVNPDILLIDEVLAVGDEAFQKKCLKQLEEFKSAGKTIILVTHGLDLVKTFCDRAVLLHQGKLVTDGTPETTIDKYHAILSTKERISEVERVVEEKMADDQTVHKISEIEDKENGEESEEIISFEPKHERYGTFEAEIADVVLRNDKDEEALTFHSGELLSICLKIQFCCNVEGPIVGFYIRKYEANSPVDIYGVHTRWKNLELGSFSKGERLDVRFLQSISLPEGTYYLVVAIANADETRFYDWHENVRAFTVKKEERCTGMLNLNSQVSISRRSRIEDLSDG
jgi:ABC-type polysaccharide/polyol phosphate transport system ATPase subunit